MVFNWLACLVLPVSSQENVHYDISSACDVSWPDICHRLLLHYHHFSQSVLAEVLKSGLRDGCSI